MDKQDESVLKNVVSGVLVVDKPVGMTSHDVVQVIRRGTGIRRAGQKLWLKVIFVVVFGALPVARVLAVTTPPSQHHEVTARPLGRPQNALVVIGIEGLDATAVVARISGSRQPTLARLANEAASGVIVPKSSAMMGKVGNLLVR